MMERQLQGVPKEQQEMLLTAVEKNPDLFMQIAKEADEKVKSGMNQMDAARSVFEAHQDELKKFLGQ